MKRIYISPYIKVKAISTSNIMVLSQINKDTFGGAPDPSKGGGDNTMIIDGNGGYGGSDQAADAKRQTLWGSPDVEE